MCVIMAEAHNEFEVVIPNETSEGQVVQARIVDLLEGLAYSSRDVFSIRLALEEALVNAIKHGNQMDPEKTVRICCTATEDAVEVAIEDQGDGFDPGDLPDPTDDDHLDLPGGRGVMLIRSFMDTVDFNDKGNRITMRKRRSQPDDDS